MSDIIITGLLIVNLLGLAGVTTYVFGLHRVLAETQFKLERLTHELLEKETKPDEPMTMPDTRLQTRFHG